MAKTSMSQPLQAAVLKCANQGERETNLADFNLTRLSIILLIKILVERETELTCYSKKHRIPYIQTPGSGHIPARAIQRRRTILKKRGQGK
jgi:hypothetical protein